MRVQILLVCFCAITLFGSYTESAPVPSTYQILPQIPGYVPVYIRKGDTPLEEINVDLAEAFRSIEERANHRKSLGDKSVLYTDIAPQTAENKHVDSVTLQKNISNEILNQHSETSVNENLQ